MQHFKFCLIAVALTQLPAALGMMCAVEPDWIHAYCQANEAGANHIFFLGSVTNKDIPEFPRRDETIYTMQVLEVFGGSIAANTAVVIHSDPMSGLGDKLQQGSKYLIEAHAEAEHEAYEIDICEDYTSFMDGYEEWMLTTLRDKSVMNQLC